MKLRAGLTVASGAGHDHLYGAASEDMYYWRTAYYVDVLWAGVLVQSEGAYGNNTVVNVSTGTGIGTATAKSAYISVGYKYKKWTPYFRFDYSDWDEKDDYDPNGLLPDWRNETTIGLNWELVEDKKALLRTAYTLESGFLNVNALRPASYSDELAGTATVSLQVEFR
jgi:hypothetical protein